MQVQENANNVTAENLLFRADEEGFSKEMINSIEDFEKGYTDISIKDRWLHSMNDRRRLHESSMG